MKKKKKSNIFKQSLRKIKYLDKTQLHYFVIMSFLIGFCLFTGTTYSYFTFSRHLNAATISIAKLSYTLTSPQSEYQNGQITVPAGETVSLDLNLASLNGIDTKYALQYSSNDANIKVYYSESLANNMSGVIGPRGSNISMRVVIENKGASASVVNFTVSGGYLQNTLETNITEGYYEADIVVRAVLLDDNYTNGIVEKNFPPKDGEYIYFRTSCNNGANVAWNEESWNLAIDNVGERTACDVYFKKVSNDIEMVFELKNADGTISYTKNVPNDGTYTYEKAECNGGATVEWDNATWQMKVSNITQKTICTGHFVATTQG